MNSSFCSWTALTLLCGLAFACNGADSGNAAPSASPPPSTAYSYQVRGENCDTGLKTFSSKVDYCVALEDDQTNASCNLAGRRQIYEKECDGQFSERTPPPGGPKVVQDLSAAGLNVTVSAGKDSADFQERLKAFWGRLEKVEDVILASRSVAHTIFIGESTSLENRMANSVTLSVDMTEEDLRAFFGLLLEADSFRGATGISLDPGTLRYGPNHEGTAALRARLNFLEQNGKPLAPAVQRIQFNAVSTEAAGYDVGSRTISLSEGSYEQDLANVAPVAAAAAPLFQFLDSAGIAFAPSFFLATPKEPNAVKFLGVVSALASQEPALTDLHQANGLAEIDTVEPGSDETSYLFRSRNIIVANYGAGLAALPGNLALLAEQAKLAQGKKLVFEYDAVLDQNFVRASGHLSQVLPQLRAKADSLDTIRFGDASRFDPSLEIKDGTSDHAYGRTLTVGARDSLTELQKAVNAIR